MDAVLAYNSVVDECFKFSITMLVIVLHYASICSYASILLLCSKLCQHNSPRPTTMALLGSTWLYFSLLDSTALYHAFTWLYLTVLNSVTLYHGFSLDIHDPTTLYHGSLGST